MPCRGNATIVLQFRDPTESNRTKQNSFADWVGNALNLSTGVKLWFLRVWGSVGLCSVGEMVRWWAAETD